MCTHCWEHGDNSTHETRDHPICVLCYGMPDLNRQDIDTHMM